jgi:hypothetical protein
MTTETTTDPDRYTEEQAAEATKALAADPIIISMFDEAYTEDQRLLGAVEVDSPNYSILALVTAVEYERRGGKIPSHMGGPFDALRLISQERYAPEEATD